MRGCGAERSASTQQHLSCSCAGSSLKLTLCAVLQHALETLLGDRGLINGAQLRRGIEQLPEEAFASKTYYEVALRGAKHITVSPEASDVLDVA